MSTSRACTAALTAALLLGLAVPASAASGITSPGAGEVVTADAVVPVRALVEAPGPSELSLQAPGAKQAEVVAVSADPGELAYDFDTACASAVCTGRQPAANGTWTVRLSGAAKDERTFVVRIPPAAPEEVEVSRSEGGVLVRWARGAEPDLRGYRIQSAAGAVLRDRIGLSACDAEGRCMAEVPEDAGAWAVRAYRATCPDCRPWLLSPASAVVRAEDTEQPVAVPPVPVVKPKPKPKSSAAAAAPARPRAQRDAFLSAFGAGRPAVSAPLPPAGAARPQALPEAPGSYDQELGYGQRELVVAEPGPPLGRAAQDAVTAALDNGNRVRLLVLGALMVAAAVWMRRWARRAIAE